MSCNLFCLPRTLVIMHLPTTGGEGITFSGPAVDRLTVNTRFA